MLLVCCWFALGWLLWLPVVVVVVVVVNMWPPAVVNTVALIDGHNMLPERTKACLIEASCAGTTGLGNSSNGRNGSTTGN